MQNETTENPWSPERDGFEETGALIRFEAIACCGCQRVIAARHITVKQNHAFCPDCVQGGKLCSMNSHHPKSGEHTLTHTQNITMFVEHNGATKHRTSYGGASGEAGDAD